MKHFEITTVSGDVIRAMASNVDGAMKIYDWKSDEGREAIVEIKTIHKRPDPRDWTGEE